MSLKKIISVLFFLMPLYFSAAQNQEQQTQVKDQLHPTVEEMLAGYLNNSLNLRKLAANVEEQTLRDKTVSIDQGMSFELSTGTVSFQFGDGGNFSFKPNANVTFPQIRNLSVGVSSEMEFGENVKTNVKNTSVTASVDIISRNGKDREISLMKSQRNVVLARRTLQDGFLNAEKEFYTSLKFLYQTQASITRLKKDLYEDELAFNTVKAQGFAKTSSKYRLAQMEVMNDQHNVDVYVHQLERETRVFAAKCGLRYEGKDACEYLPMEINDVEPIDIMSLPRDSYEEIENAVWDHEIQKMVRDADCNFSLSANSGVTFNNQIRDENYETTLDAGVVFGIYGSGLKINAGMNVPASFNQSPVFKMGLSVDPNMFRKAPLEDQLKSVAEEKELTSIRMAHQNYLNDVILQKSTLVDLLWSRDTNLESLDLYTKLETDQRSFYEKGYITESEYRSVQVNLENTRIQTVIDKVNIILYNNQTKLLFVDIQESDGEKTEQEN